MPKTLVNFFDGYLFENQREKFRTVCDHADIDRASLVACAAVRQSMQWKRNGCWIHRLFHEGERGRNQLARHEAGN